MTSHADPIDQISAANQIRDRVLFTGRRSHPFARKDTRSGPTTVEIGHAWVAGDDRVGDPTERPCTNEALTADTLNGLAVEGRPRTPARRTRAAGYPTFAGIMPGRRVLDRRISGVVEVVT